MGKRTANVLHKAWKLISKPERWIKGREASLGPDGTMSYCTIGAVKSVTKSPISRSAARDALRLAIPVRANTDRIASYNDAPTRRHHHIRQWFARAVKNEDGGELEP